MINKQVEIIHKKSEESDEESPDKGAKKFVKEKSPIDVKGNNSNINKNKE